MKDRPKVLAVDDEAFNLDIICEYLENANYEVLTATNGEEALKILQQTQDIDVIVLDRMMPFMSGMQVLTEIKKDKMLAHIPVIMQTAAAQTQQVTQGIQAGVFYYLTKPYEEEVFLSIVHSAIDRYELLKELFGNIPSQEILKSTLKKACFYFQTIEEAKNISLFMSRFFPDPQTAVYGLSELTLNAIEHGNLGITYEEKTKLLQSRLLLEEIEKRYKDSVAKSRYAFLEYLLDDNKIQIRIKDQGNGFDWKKYLELSPERATDPHGRGIAMAKTLSFSRLEYQGCGNEVVATYFLKEEV